MATTTTKYWQDFDNEFNRQNNGDVVVMKNIDAIFNSLRNIFETFQGSRRMLPEFALPIHSLLFEPVDEITAYKLGEMILEAVERWEPRITVDNVDVKGRPDNNEYRVRLEFRVVNDSRYDSAQVFNNILRAT
jgi:phage baseplate assembly protein W